MTRPGRLKSYIFQKKKEDTREIQKEDTREIQKVLDELPFLLEFIQLPDGPVMGSKMESKIEDDLGHFLVNYDFPVRRKVDEGPSMEEVEIMGGIKSGQKPGE